MLMTMSLSNRIQTRNHHSLLKVKLNNSIHIRWGHRILRPKMNKRWSMFIHYKIVMKTLYLLILVTKILRKCSKNSKYMLLLKKYHIILKRYSNKDNIWARMMKKELKIMWKKSWRSQQNKKQNLWVRDLISLPIRVCHQALVTDNQKHH